MQTLRPIVIDQPIFLGLLTVADCVEIFGFQGKVQLHSLCIPKCGCGEKHGQSIFAVSSAVRHIEISLYDFMEVTIIL